MLEKLMGMPVVASEEGPAIDDFIIYIHILMALLFVGWLGYYFYTLWRFRASRSRAANYRGAQTHASTYIELAVAFVEAVLLIGFAIPAWAKVVDTLPEGEGLVRVRVMAQQFGWNFVHPGTDGIFGAQSIAKVTQDNKFGRDLEDPAGQDDFLTYNDLHLPIDQPVVFGISSLDVIHSFKVIALRVCQDAIPGLQIPTWCTPKIPGRYQINCAQLCGNGHSAMIGGFLTVEPQEDYETWLQEKVAAATAAAAAGDAGGGGFE